MLGEEDSNKELEEAYSIGTGMEESDKPDRPLLPLPPPPRRMHNTFVNPTPNYNTSIGVGDDMQLDDDLVIVVGNGKESKQPERITSIFNEMGSDREASRSSSSNRDLGRHDSSDGYGDDFEGQVNNHNDHKYGYYDHHHRIESRSSSPQAQPLPSNKNSNINKKLGSAKRSMNELLQKALEEAANPGEDDAEPEVLPLPSNGEEEEQYEQADEDDEGVEEEEEATEGTIAMAEGEEGTAAASGAAAGPKRLKSRKASSENDMKRSRRDPAQLEAEAKRLAILEEERRVAALTFDEDALAPRVENMMERAKYIPLRLTYEERKSLRMVNAAVSVSDYTNVVDVAFKNKVRRQHVQLQQIVALLTGLVAGGSYPEGQDVLQTRNFKPYQQKLGEQFEIARRYKITNPEKLRSEYGKLVYLLQDTINPDVQPLLGVNVVAPVKTVYSLCQEKGALALLDDKLLATATEEILSDGGKSRATVEMEIKRKEKAVKKLVGKYAKVSLSSSYSGQSMRSWNWSSYSSSSSYLSYQDRQREEEEEEEMRRTRVPTDMSEDEVRMCLYSISDNNSFLNANKKPISDCLALLEKFFGDADGESEGSAGLDPERSLAIDLGQGGSRLTHSHAMQFNYVKQSLTLWSAIMEDMYRLWHLAEQDLLSPDVTYELRNTGQGLQRVQSSPRVYRAMHEILARTKQALGNWIGSSVIHLGDNNVPNALSFIDKYVQVAQILGPLVNTLNQIDKACEEDTGLRAYMEAYGGVEMAKRDILRDFFTHAFDGSGGNNDFDAGSCIDGRLTSAWNWCSQIADKPFYPLFRMTGFMSFSGEFGER